MDQRLIALVEKRALLVARAEYQRAELGRQLDPLKPACQTVDQIVRAGKYLAARPYLVAVATLAVILIKPRRAWQWARRGWSIWKFLQKFQRRA